MVAVRKAIALLVLMLGAPLSGVAGSSLSIIQPPNGFDEGTETKLSTSQLAEILPWAMNSEIALKELQDSVRTLSTLQSKQALIEGIRRVVSASAPKQTELLMRYILNRALKVSDEIEKEADTRVAGVVAQQVRVLKLSIAMALDYYESDLEFLNGSVTQGNETVHPPYARFGVEYARFLLSIDNSLIFARAQYNIAVIALGLLQWDLHRDVNNAAYGPAIAKVQSTLASVPERASGSDAQVVSQLRSVKKGLLRAIELADRVVGHSAVSEAEFQSAIKQVNEKLFSKGDYYYSRVFDSFPNFSCPIMEVRTRQSADLEIFSGINPAMDVENLKAAFQKRKEVALDSVAQILLDRLKSAGGSSSMQEVRKRVERVVRFEGVPVFQSSCMSGVEDTFFWIGIVPGTFALQYARK